MRWKEAFRKTVVLALASSRLNLVKAIKRYSAHGMSCVNLGLSIARTFISSIFSSCPIIIILAHKLTSEPTSPLVAIFVATWRGYLEQLCIPALIINVLMLCFFPWVLYITVVTANVHGKVCQCSCCDLFIHFNTHIIDLNVNQLSKQWAIVIRRKS